MIRGDSVVILGNIHDQPLPVGNLKEVSLEELQEMEEQAAQAKAGGKDTAGSTATNGSSDGPLTWDFDTDLIA